MSLFGKKRLDGKDILALKDLPTEDVDVPEWGTTVRVRALNLEERLRILGKRDEEADPVEAALSQSIALVVTAAINEDGQPLFTAEDGPTLRTKSYPAINRLAGRILRISLVGVEAIEEAKKNSSETPSGDSLSS